jgi:thermostable 8-oxoguanine DNA glycosylase
MVKKFMEDTGASKKEATNMLRKCKWDYSTAKTLYIIEKFDWNKLVKNMNEIIESTVETLKRMMDTLAERLPTIIENLKEKKGGE